MPLPIQVTAIVAAATALGVAGFAIMQDGHGEAIALAQQQQAVDGGPAGQSLAEQRADGKAMSEPDARLSVPVAKDKGQGKITDWSGGRADLMAWRMGAPPEVIGQITEDGMVMFDLPAEFEATQPLSKVFGCSDGGVTVTDPEAKYFITLPLLDVGSMAGGTRMGGVIAATTQAIAASRAGEGQPAAGRYYQWLYTPDDATIEGKCAFDIFPDGKTRTEVHSTFDLSLEPGWNIFEIEMADIQSMQDGATVAIERTYRTVDALPAEAKWYYWPE